MAWIPDKPENYPLRKRKMRLENGGEINWGRRRWRKLLLFREDMTRLFTVDSNSNATKSLRSLWKNEEGKREVHEAISAVYDPAEEQRIKPPNKVEMRKLAQRWLEKHRGASVHGAWIEELAADPQYNARRGKPGATVKGLLLPVSELKI